MKDAPVAYRHICAHVRAFIVLGAAALALSFSGCAGPHKNYHPDLTPGRVGSSSAVWEEENRPYFGFVEFDDQGERWDSSVRASKPGEAPTTQLQAVMCAIRKAGGGGDKPFYLIIFAHGWNNNAKPDNGNLKDFHRRICELRELHKRDGVGIFGVYLAWRGDAPFKVVNFYHRNEGGHRVGERATGAIFDIITAGRQASSRSKIALVGHSFGAHLVESGVLPVLQADVARAANNKNLTPLAADLILLVNPARSSLYSKPLVDQLRDTPVKVQVGGDASPRSLPLIVSITSETDKATGKAFPLGYYVGRRISLFNTGVSGLHRKEKSDPEGQAFSHQHTSGWNKALHSHKVKPEAFPPGGNPKKSPPGSDPTPEDIDRMIRANYTPWQSDGSILVHGFKHNYRIDPAPPQKGNDVAYNNTPYWIMQVPKDIVHGHTDVWNHEYVGLVTALLYLPLQDRQAADSVRQPPSRSRSRDLTGQRLMLQRKY